MGELINITGQLSDSQISQAIARDTETAATMADHEGKNDPHPIYLTKAEADLLYRSISLAAPMYFASQLPAANLAGNSMAFGWNSVQPGQGVAELGNYCGTGGGNTLDVFLVPGNPASTPSLANRVASITRTGAYAQTSDRRVKSHFSPAPGLSIVLALQPKKYRHWDIAGLDKDGIKLGERFRETMGFLAQEVEAVVPQAVLRPANPQVELYAMDYTVLIPCLVQAIQEQQIQIQELQAQVTDFKSYLATNLD